MLSNPKPSIAGGSEAWSVRLFLVVVQIVVIVIIGAFLTPGDLIWTTIALAVPLYMLYELSVAASYVIYKRKQRKRAQLEAEQSGAPA